MFFRIFKWLTIGLLMLWFAPAVQAQDLSAATQHLFESVENDDLAGVQISIAGGGDINAYNDWGLTPVDLAADKGYFEIVHYLLSVRDVLDSRRTTQPPPAPTQATVIPVPPEGALQPPPAPAPVAEVYSPPPGSDPWSATVVTSEPPQETPAAFDPQQSVPGTSLPVIGEVRGPAIDLAVRPPNPEPALEPEPATQAASIPQATTQSLPVAPPPIEVDDGPGIFDQVKNFFSFGSEDAEKPEETVIGAAQTKPAPETVSPVIQPEPEPEPEPTTVGPTPEQVRQALAASPPTAPVSTPGDGPQSIEGKIFPEPVTQALMLPALDKNTPPPTVESVTEKPEPAAPPPEKTKVGTTTPPGKPKDERGLFDKVTSFFGIGNDQGKDENSSEEGAKKSGQFGDWSVKQIEQAQLAPRPPDEKPLVRKKKLSPDPRLDGVILSLGTTTSLGKAMPQQEPAPWFQKSCVSKKSDSVVFCIEPLDWPDDISPHFLSDSIMYEGNKVIVRYDEGSATYFHTLFPSQSYPMIVDFFTRRYGKPTKQINRSIAPLASPRMENPTVIWKSIAPVTNLLTTLEIRMFDDNRGGFPDTKRGAVYLYHEWSQPVFPQLSSVELMLLRAEKRTE
ncbi:MAG: hypothetical protein HQ504_03730 [Rhodospirillaceae bacterium]|nr:hypothetical protein [Rhodospirillaceae bacterium]